MANHGYVKTKIPMTHEDLIGVIKELNKRNFKNKVTYDVYTDEAPHVIEVFHKGIYACQVWLNNKKSCEVRHGGGSDTAWWVDTLIRHTIAQRFSGIITDDGHEIKELGKPENYTTYRKYLSKMHGSNWMQKFGKELTHYLLEQE